jgi:hypothetical protein
MFQPPAVELIANLERYFFNPHQKNTFLNPLIKKLKAGVIQRQIHEHQIKANFYF